MNIFLSSNFSKLMINRNFKSMLLLSVILKPLFRILIKPNKNCKIPLLFLLLLESKALPENYSLFIYMRPRNSIRQQTSDIQPFTIIISNNSAATASSNEASGRRNKEISADWRETAQQSWQCWIMRANAFKYSAFPFHQTIHWTIRNGEYFLSGIIVQTFNGLRGA